MESHELEAFRARCLKAKTYNRHVANAEAYVAALEAEAGPVPMRPHMAKHSPDHLMALVDKVLRVRAGEEHDRLVGPFSSEEKPKKKSASKKKAATKKKSSKKAQEKAVEAAPEPVEEPVAEEPPAEEKAEEEAPPAAEEATE